MEFLLALLLKFWVMIWGLVTGSITSFPFFRRLLLKRALVSEFDGRTLVLSCTETPFLLKDFSVRIPDTGMRWYVAHACAQLTLGMHDRREFRLPDRCDRLMIEAELIDLRKGRRAHLFRKLIPEAMPRS